MPDDVTLNINLKIGGPGAATLIRRDSDKAVNFAIEGVAFRAAKNRQRRLQANLQRDFAPVVERELQQMARDVSRLAIGINGDSGNTSPTGILSISGRISKPMIGNSGPMSISSMTGQWAARTKAYMRWKMRKYRTRKWFKNTGKLEKSMGRASTYQNAYGPIRIRFTPTNLGYGALSSFGRSSGGQSRNIQIGRLEVTPLRRLRLSDLPGIGQKADYNPRLLSPFSNSVERKLTGRPSTVGYRPVIEPFLSYYLTRKIPNAVYRRLEDSL